MKTMTIESGTDSEGKIRELELANRGLQAALIERERSLQERSRAEEKLRQAQKMEAIGTFAGGIAHDFNNILAGIMGFAELGRSEPHDPVATAQYFEEIAKAGQRARNLVRQILAFSRNRQQDRKPLQLEPVLTDALRLFRTTLPESIHLRVHCASDLPDVLGECVQMQQLISNLLSNSHHALGERTGEIRVELQAVTISLEDAQTSSDLRPGRYVTLRVKDTGHGMDAATASRIFDPFFTTKPAGKGSGLGLSAVHGIVKSMDGAISVTTAPEKGADFLLFFPALEFDALDASLEDSGVPRGSGERILFVDDETVLTTLGERFLKRLGYDPVVYNDPRRALLRFREEPFDLVITDLTMPQWSGLDFSAKIWEVRNDVRIILITGFSAALDRARALDLGFCELLLKPYDLRILGQTVHEALQRCPPSLVQAV